MGHNYVIFQLQSVIREPVFDSQLRECNLLTEGGTHGKAS